MWRHDNYQGWRNNQMENWRKQWKNKLHFHPQYQLRTWTHYLPDIVTAVVSTSCWYLYENWWHIVQRQVQSLHYILEPVKVQAYHTMRPGDQHWTHMLIPKGQKLPCFCHWSRRKLVTDNKEHVWFDAALVFDDKDEVDESLLVLVTMKMKTMNWKSPNIGTTPFQRNITWCQPTHCSPEVRESDCRHSGDSYATCRCGKLIIRAALFREPPIKILLLELPPRKLLIKETLTNLWYESPSATSTSFGSPNY